MMTADIIKLIGARIVVRCGHIQPDHSSCGRRLAVWTLEGAGSEDGGWRLRETRPPRGDADRVRGKRVSYTCHPKRCGAKNDLRLPVITSRILEGWMADAPSYGLATVRIGGSHSLSGAGGMLLPKLAMRLRA